MSDPDPGSLGERWKALLAAIVASGPLLYQLVRWMRKTARAARGVDSSAPPPGRRHNHVEVPPPPPVPQRCDTPNQELLGALAAMGAELAQKANEELDRRGQIRQLEIQLRESEKMLRAANEELEKARAENRDAIARIARLEAELETIKLRYSSGSHSPV